MNLVTGSRTLLTLACPPWSLLPAPRESSALSVEGQDVHAFVQRVAYWMTHLREQGEPTDQTWPYQKALGEVPARSRARCESLDLEPLALFLRPGAFSCEVGIAYNPVTGDAKRLPDGTREESYRGLDPAVWIGCKLDFLGLSEDAVVLADLKGRWPDPTAARAQLATYALAAARLYGKMRASCYLLPARNDGSTEPMRPWELDSAALEAHAEKLRQAWVARDDAAEDLRVAPGCHPEALLPYLHLGPHCERCPARFSCPARINLALQMATDFTADGALDVRFALTPEIAPRVLDRIRQIKSVIGPVEEEIKALARRCGGIPLPNGEVYGAREETDSIDVDGALAAVAALDPEMLSDVEASVTTSLTMGAVMDAAGKHRRPGETVGAAKKRARETLEAAGCVRKRVAVKASKGSCLPPEEP